MTFIHIRSWEVRHALLPRLWGTISNSSCGAIFCDTKAKGCLSTVLHRERRHGGAVSPGRPGSPSPRGACAERAVTNGNYICVFFMNPSNTGLLKMLPGYLRLSDPGDQIGMLLRQSRSTHPLFACDVFDRVCRGIPCIIQLQMYTLNSCWYVGSRAVRRPIWTVFFSPLPPFRTITWCFNATCQLVYSHRLQYNACFLRLVRVFNFYYLSYLWLKATFIFYRGGTFLLGCIGLWAFVRPMRSYQCAPDAHNILCSVVLETCCKMHVQRVPDWAAFEAVWWSRR